MYLGFYGLLDYPYAITPNPAYLYLSVHHREALGHLIYGTSERGSFVQLTGEVGTGKTTLIRALLEQATPELDIALCLNPHLTVHEFVASVVDELGVQCPDDGDVSLKGLVDALNQHLLAGHAAGRRTVLIVDEAQNLSAEVLEQLRLLTNLETHTHKLMRVILVGQPELETHLRSQHLRQLAQRITARYHLRALTQTETRAYIQHRLQVAGGDGHLFTDRACRAVYTVSGGIPRLINTVCERALMGGYSTDSHRIDARIVHRAADEALPSMERGRRPLLRSRFLYVPAFVVCVLIIGGVYTGLHKPDIATTDAEAGGVSLPDKTAQTNQASQPRNTHQKLVGTDPSEQSDKQNQPIENSVEKGHSAQALTFPESDVTMTRLLRLWGVFGAPVDSSCRALSIGELRCVRIDATFQDLVDFNRPALLVFAFEQGRRTVLLANLASQHATLILGHDTKRVSRKQIKQLWTGQAHVIWRQPIDVRSVQPGFVGSAVVWIRRQIAHVRGKDLTKQSGQPSLIYDQALQQQIRTFQRRHGLTVDGIVGPRTIMTFNSIDPAAGTPVLIEPGAD